MSAPLIPQEIYLLERYSSLDYFGAMRDGFAACVKAAQDALAEFMQHLPPDYRSQHLSHQPDAVWGERVIPNMQWALDGLNKGYIRISHDDLDALGLACNVKTTFAAINRDYLFDWMPQPFYDQFDNAWLACSGPASNINFTSLGDWTKGALTTRYKESNRGPLDPPPTWPQYRVNPQVRVKTGDVVPQNGIYLPDDERGCAQLLIKGYQAWEILLPMDPNNHEAQPRDERSLPTTWTLVERVVGSGGDTDAPGANATSTRLRCEAGKPCPAEGEWFTPGVQGTRLFVLGEIMPDMKSDYGQTIWYCEQQTT